MSKFGRAVTTARAARASLANWSVIWIDLACTVTWSARKAKCWLLNSVRDATTTTTRLATPLATTSSTSVKARRRAVRRRQLVDEVVLDTISANVSCERTGAGRRARGPIQRQGDKAEIVRVAGVCAREIRDGDGAGIHRAFAGVVGGAVVV